MSNTCRIEGLGHIDRARRLRFTFDGRDYVGFAGDTLASALLANGVHLVGRSFKYHRPRGIMGAWADEPNALVTLYPGGPRHTPNIPATQIELVDGLAAISQNRGRHLARDWRRIFDRLGRFLPAGFYYKTFMWPRFAWKALYEPGIRAIAGLGVAPTVSDPDRYAQRFAHCDVLVVGSGPSGLTAALEAARAGCRVILCDEKPDLGGTLSSSVGAAISDLDARDWRDGVVAELAAHPKVRLLSRTTAFGLYPHEMAGLCERIHRPDQRPGDVPRERLWQVRARQIVVATGAIERPLIFPDNDRPGIMLADAARVYLQVFGVAVGWRPVIVTSHDAGYRVAHEFHAAGISPILVDVRNDAASSDTPFRVIRGAQLLGTKGNLRVSALILSVDGATEAIPCDAVLMCGGFTPSIHLASHARSALEWREDALAFVPAPTDEAVQCTGASAGDFSLQAALAAGVRAGRRAAEQSGFRATGLPAYPECRIVHSLGSGGSVGLSAGQVPAGMKKAFVDWQNDVTVSDLALATREGFQSIEHVKRYTTTGMATDQGRLSNLNAMAIVAAITGRPIAKVGLTTFRPPYTPITFGTLAGPARGTLFEPLRTTPIHDWATARGAIFEDVGQWRRARYFPAAGETMEQAVARECRAVRGAVGMFDASTLGKIEVVGKDAAEFLNRLYVNDWTNLAPGKCKYGLLLREDGFVADDGVIGRLADDRFHVTTTTTGAPRVMMIMEDYLQTEWPDLDVWLTTITDQWSVIAVQGPKAREVIAPLVQNIDLAGDSFPHMSVAEGRIGDVPLRLMRVSFTGELGYELNVPSCYAQQIWDAVWDRGQAVGITAYGTEAMHVLRAEKGYIIIGQETDGTVTPSDLGLNWAIGKKKLDFVGKRSLARAAMLRPERKQLVGLMTLDSREILDEGAQIIVDRSGRSIGHVTSAYYSAELDRPIALAMVEAGRSRHGSSLFAAMNGRSIPVEVVKPLFVDSAGVRLHG